MSIDRKRVTLHPLKEDGTIDLDTNLYPKTFLDGIVDREGNEVRVATYLEASKMIDITWSELKALRDSSQLVKGMQYRIIDYVTTTTQVRTQSAGHAFDIIVVADDTNKLNENVRAIQHVGDTYFANSNLASWQLKYCLDNDSDRFAWADTLNGKGVIYYLKDEYNNECSYDFKNIKFARYKITTCEICPSLVNKYLGNYDLNGALNLTRDISVDENDTHYYFTFDCCDTDYSLNAIDTTLTRPDGSTFTLDQIQCMDCFICATTIDSAKQYLNNIVIMLESSRDILGLRIEGSDSRSSTLLGGSNCTRIYYIANSLIGSIGTSFIDGYVGMHSTVEMIEHTLACLDNVVQIVFNRSTIGTIKDSDLVGSNNSMFDFSSIENIRFCTIKTTSNIAFYSTIGTIYSCNLEAPYVFYYSQVVNMYSCNAKASIMLCGSSNIAYLNDITQYVEDDSQPDYYLYGCSISFMRQCTIQNMIYATVQYIFDCTLRRISSSLFINCERVECLQDIGGCIFKGKNHYVNISSTTTTQTISNTTFHAIYGTSESPKTIVIPEDYSIEHSVDIYMSNHRDIEV